MYTQMAVFAQVDAAGKLHLVNHLGIRLGDTPEDVLRRLDRGEFPEADIQPDAGAASDRNYVTHVREYEHHLLLKVPAEGVPEMKAYLEGYFAKASGGYFECSNEEGNKAFRQMSMFAKYREAAT
jgi:hypothetical protein